jgi:hypothetical protein
MGSSSTASNARKPLLQKAPVKASSQKGSASLAGSSGKATASTNITSSPLAVAAASAANRTADACPQAGNLSNARLQARGRAEPRALGASLIRLLSLRLKPKAAAAPNSGRGPGAGQQAG